MKKTLHRGFSLMEMMIVLLIVAIVAAATAPMVTKKMRRNADFANNNRNGASFWEEIDEERIQPVEGIFGIRLNTDDTHPAAIKTNNNAFIFTGDGGGNNGGGDNSFASSNVIGIGNAITSGTNQATNTIAIGFGVSSAGNRSIAIGNQRDNSRTTATNSDSIAIGSHVESSGIESIAIGANTSVQAQNSIAIGSNITVNGINTNQINIGNKFMYNGNTSNPQQTFGAQQFNVITLGNSSDTVVIPGKLMVGTQIGDTEYGCLWANIGRKGLSYGSEETSKGWLQLTESNDSHLKINHTSDRRLKNVGEKFEAGLNELKQLEFFHYTFKDDINKTPRVGVMAQDLQKVFPDAVTEGEDGYLRIRMEDMFYAMINAVKELETRFNIIVNQVKMYFDKVDALEATVEAQKQEIEALKMQNAEFEERLAKLEKKRWNK